MPSALRARDITIHAEQQPREKKRKKKKNVGKGQEAIVEEITQRHGDRKGRAANNQANVDRDRALRGFLCFFLRPLFFWLVHSKSSKAIVFATS